MSLLSVVSKGLTAPVATVLPVRHEEKRLTPVVEDRDKKRALSNQIIDLIVARVGVYIPNQPLSINLLASDHILIQEFILSTLDNNSLQLLTIFMSDTTDIQKFLTTTYPDATGTLTQIPNGTTFTFQVLNKIIYIVQYPYESLLIAAYGFASNCFCLFNAFATDRNFTALLESTMPSLVLGVMVGTTHIKDPRFYLENLPSTSGEIVIGHKMEKRQMFSNKFEPVPAQSQVQKFVSPRKIVEEPVKRRLVTTIATYKSDEWVKQLKDFLRNYLLAPLMKPENIEKHFNNPKAFDYWVKAFTHETLDPVNNYNELSQIGDRVLDLNMVKLIYFKYPTANRKQVQVTKSHYVSKVRFNKLSFDMDLVKFILMRDADLSIHIPEDVFEAVFGALNEAQNVVLNDPDAGLIVCGRLFRMIYVTPGVQLPPNRFPKVNIELQAIDPKTRVKEIFNRMYWEENIDWHKDPESRTGTARILIDRENAAIYRLPMVLGSATASTKKEAVIKAAINALETLERANITTKTSYEIKFDRDLREAGLYDKKEIIRQKLEADGYNKLFFKVPKTVSGVDKVTLQLIGSNEEGTDQKIYQSARIDRESQSQYRVEFLKNFIAS